MKKITNKDNELEFYIARGCVKLRFKNGVTFKSMLESKNKGVRSVSKSIDMD